MRMIPLPDAAAGPLAWLAAVDGKWYARVVYGLDLGSVSPLAAMPGLQTPVLFIHGLSDDQTPAEDSRRLAVASRAAQLWLVPRLGHASAYSADPEEYRRRVFGWFEAH